jgi:hypothetical protein
MHGLVILQPLERDNVIIYIIIQLLDSCIQRVQHQLVTSKLLSAWFN